MGFLAVMAAACAPDATGGMAGHWSGRMVQQRSGTRSDVAGGTRALPSITDEADTVVEVQTWTVERAPDHQGLVLRLVCAPLALDGSPLEMHAPRTTCRSREVDQSGTTRTITYTWDSLTLTRHGPDALTLHGVLRRDEEQVDGSGMRDYEEHERTDVSMDAHRVSHH